MLLPTEVPISSLDATITSDELSPREIYIRIVLKAPIFWPDGLVASILAEAILTSLIASVFEPCPVNIWSKLLAWLVADSVVLVLLEAGTNNVAV